MAKTTLITPSEVRDIAYAGEEYTPLELITSASITVAEQRYLIPVIGTELYTALSEGEYSTLLEDYVAPALALYTREVINAPAAPSSPFGMRRARAMMLHLSDLLEDSPSDYPEYKSEDNILNRCRIYGGNIQIR